VDWTAMPEASVHKNGQPLAGKYDICSPGRPIENPPMQAKA
jgi:hypothetical protein